MSHMPHCFHSEARCCPDLIFKSVWRRKAVMQDWRREAASIRVPVGAARQPLKTTAVPQVSLKNSEAWQFLRMLLRTLLEAMLSMIAAVVLSLPAVCVLGSACSSGVFDCRS